MPLGVLFRPEAQAEALETRAWYAQREASLGEAFTAELAKAVSAIREHPLQFTRVRGETRRVILNRFPYAVYFRVTEAEVIVLAVHGRQSPKQWRSRK